MMRIARISPKSKVLANHRYEIILGMYVPKGKEQQLFAFYAAISGGNS
jgi:hypothetical protein